MFCQFKHTPKNIDKKATKPTATNFVLEQLMIAMHGVVVVMHRMRKLNQYLRRTEVQPRKSTPTHIPDSKNACDIL